MTEDEYRRFVAHQRSLVDAYIGTQLDQWCVDLGWQPNLWRLLHQRDVIVRFTADTSRFAEQIRRAGTDAARALTALREQVRR